MKNIKLFFLISLFVLGFDFAYAHPVMRLAGVAALQGSLPENEQDELDEFRYSLLGGLLGFKASGEAEKLSERNKKFIGKHLNLIFHCCPWLTHVNLKALGLVYLPRSIGKLIELQHLDLGENHIRYIPNEVLKLSKLKTLVLEDNPLVALSPELLEMLESRGNDYQLDHTKRTNLRLGYEHYEARMWFIGEMLFNIFERQKRDVLFDELVAGYIGFYPNGEVRLHDDATKKCIKSKLSKFDKYKGCLTHVNFTGYSFTEIPKEIKDWSQLKVLLLKHNLLKSIPDFFKRYRKLQTLDLSFNNFLVFPAGLHEQESIETLLMTYNKMVEFSPRDLTMPNLKVLDLSHNELKAFPKDYVNFPILERLNLSFTKTRFLKYLMSIAPQLTSLDLQETPVESLPLEFKDIVTGLSGERKRELVEMESRVERVHLLLYLVEFDKDELADELFRGTIGIKMDGGPRTLRDVEKNFILWNLDLIVEVIPWLTHLNFSSMNLEEMPDSLQKLGRLKSLDLSSNHLKRLPEFVFHYPELSRLILSNNEFSEIPEGLERLPQLQHLNLSYNQIRRVGPALAGCKKLKFLSLAGNLMRTVPDELYELTSLGTLLLHNTPLLSLSSNIEKLTKLEKIDLSNTQLDHLPEEVASLPQLCTLALNRSHFRTLPTALKDAPRLEHLELNQHALQAASDQTGMGYKYVKSHFGAVAALSPLKQFPKGGFIGEAQLYERLDNEAVRWNRKRLAAVVVPKTPQRKMTGEEMLKEWAEIWCGMNITTPERLDYLDYYMLTQDTPKEAEHRNNKALMDQEFVPRMKGFLKAVFELPLEEGETYGWVISPTQKPAMRNVVAVILKYLLDSDDPDYRARIFVQFVAGALFCQTGQKTNFETILLSLSEENETGAMVNVEDFSTQLLSLLAYEKEKSFRNVTNDTTNAQSTHLYEYYKARLSEELGLSSALENYKDIHGIQGKDPFSGCTGNVLAAFYEDFATCCFADRVLSKVASEEEVEFLRGRHSTAADKAKAEEIATTKPLRFATIVAYMMDQGLLTQHELRDEDDPDAERPKWESYFVGHPQDEGSVVKHKAIEDIMVHMGLLVR